MTILFTQSSFESIIIGVISNIIFTFIVIYTLQRFRYWYFLKRKFHNQTFKTHRKRFPEETVQTVTCKVKGNRIKIDGVGIKSNINDRFEGEIIINPLNLKTGEGFHTHAESDGYAFLKVIIKDDNTFLVDAPYTKVI